MHSIFVKILFLAFLRSEEQWGLIKSREIVELQYF